MNLDIETALRDVQTDSHALDPERVIAGARRRRRRGVVTAAAASAGVVAVAVAGVFAANGPTATQLPVATQPTTPPPTSPTAAPRFVFKNKRPAVGTLAAGVEVKLSPYLFFKTKGTKWAVISRRPGEPEYEPFGWRKTVGDPNIGDGTSPGMQTVDDVVTTVFRSSTVETVVYALGNQVWYGKVRRLTGIPGWVFVAARVPAQSPRGPHLGVFGYDATGKLVAVGGDTKTDPLHP